jgi:hypothetical protein
MANFFKLIALGMALGCSQAESAEMWLGTYSGNSAQSSSTSIFVKRSRWLAAPQNNGR